MTGSSTAVCQQVPTSGWKNIKTFHVKISVRYGLELQMALESVKCYSGDSTATILETWSREEASVGRIL